MNAPPGPQPDAATAALGPQECRVGSPAWRILCVDDEPNIVSALRRLFRSAGYQVLTATSGAEALALMESEPVDLIFSDMRMPGMDGVQLLEQVRKRWPRTTRILLTGYADIQSTVAAINSGEVYRYVTKPWDDADITATARQVFEQHALRLEKERLEDQLRSKNVELAELNASLEDKVAARTEELLQLSQKLKRNYLTSIKVFSNLLEWRGGQLSGHSRRVADLARRTARAMDMGDAEVQELFIAGLLHDIGQIGLSDSVLARPVPRLNEEETALYRRHAARGEQALTAMDDMQAVATLIRTHHERHDGQGYPDGLGGSAIAQGARILAVVDTFDELQLGHLSMTPLTAADARAMIARGRGTQFDPEVVDVFLQVLLQSAPAAAEAVVMSAVADLQPGMVLARDLVSGDGIVLLAAGQVLTAELIRRLHARQARDGVAMLLPMRAREGRHRG